MRSSAYAVAGADFSTRTLKIRRLSLDNILPLDPSRVRTIDRTGGTFLHTSRTNPGRVRNSEIPEFLSADGEGPHDFTSHVLRVLESQGIDVLIPIGGDDTLSYGLRMHEEGVPVIAIPKTMDNDVHGTDYCIGFSTAVTRGVQFIHNLRTSTGSHERIAVVELFGRYSGETSLITAYLAGVDRALISEVPSTLIASARCSSKIGHRTLPTTRWSRSPRALR